MSTCNFPISNDHKIARLTNLLQAYIARENENFTFCNETLSSEEVVSYLGCLPLFLMKSEENYQSVFGRSMGILFYEEEEGSIVGVSANLPLADSVPFTVLAHFTQYSMEEYMRQYKKNRMLRINDMIPLEPLFNEWNQALQKKDFLRVLPAPPPVFPGQRN